MNTFEWTEETPVTANNMNEMQNILNDKFNYTQEEQRIGTWIDGKPIYRKVIQGSATNNYNLNISSVITNYNEMTDMKIRFSYTGSTNIYFESFNRSGVEQQIFIGGNNTQIIFRGTNNFISYTITLEYTKTTD